MKDEQNDIVNDLIPRYLAGETSAEEESQLLNWISKSPKNEQDYLVSKKIFELSQQHYASRSAESFDIDIDKEWNQFVSNINKKEKPIRYLTNNTSQLWYKIAAAILILLVSGYLVNYFATKTNEIQHNTAENTQVVILPDGSRVTLNKHSQIAYTADFGKRGRNIKLTGEAFFDIKRDPENPFKIEVNKAVIEVLGTSFNVRAYDILKDVEVIVETGVVKFSIPDRKMEVKLTAGQKGVYTKMDQNITSGINEDINFLSWNTQKIIFEESDLLTVIETLNKTYQTNIIIATDIPPTCEVTVAFDHQTLESVLHVLESTLNLTFTREGNQIKITKAGC